MSDEPHTVQFSFDYTGEDSARAVAEALSPELGEIDDDRSRTRLARDGAVLTLFVEASDLVALRAAVNTWLSLVEVAERVATVTKIPGGTGTD